MDDEIHDPAGGKLVPRDPTLADLAELCAKLTAGEVRFVVVGGFAIRATGYTKNTGDIDLLIEATLENERRALEVLATLPDGCAREVTPGEVAQYTVVRIADEFIVDLMASACGITYAEAIRDAVIREVDGVPIPFASPRMLWRMKAHTHREKDIPDLAFLRHYFAARGEKPAD